MSAPILFPDTPSRGFAIEVVRRLRHAGFEAVWAGGCVRDALLGLHPGDFDVATSARPEEVVRLFGDGRTVAIGAAFGVIMVLGHPASEVQVEVATYRLDGAYSDGRRPDDVVFCSAEEDARRRDFTINGMFYDPLNGQLLDYVGGLDDLRSGIVRAIGEARRRFAEDRLRMLRAVRFTATLEFILDEATAEAIHDAADAIRNVSVERITQELRRMLAHPTRADALELMSSTKLLISLFPDLSPDTYRFAAAVLPHLRLRQFEPSLAVLIQDRLDASAEASRQRTGGVMAECRRLRLANHESAKVCWLTEQFSQTLNTAALPLHRIKRLLADERHDLLLDLLTAAAKAGLRPSEDARFLVSYRARVDPAMLNPDAFITGADLTDLGLRPGPDFGRILEQIRIEQLDELISSREEALARAMHLMGEQ